MLQNSLIISKLDAFIRKYYKNQLIRGAIYAISALLFLFLLMAILEYFGYFSTIVRTLFFWFYAAFFAFCVVKFIAIPLAKMHKIGRHLSYEQAAVIIGKYFPEVSDKLLNLLQLQSMAEIKNSELLLASIEQKTRDLSPIPFYNAINIKANRKYFKFVLIPLIIIVLLLFVSPSVIKDSSSRILHYSTFYEKPAPFSFKILSSPLQVAQQENFTLNIKIDGNTVPDEVFIHFLGREYKMQKLDKTNFSYVFRNVQNTIEFYLEAAEVKSQIFELVVFPKPTLLNFGLQISYPAYTQKPSETIYNTGDISVPEGSVVKWIFQTKNTDNLYFITNNKTESLKPVSNGQITKTLRLLSNFKYGFFTSNKFVNTSDTLFYEVSTIPDIFPMIVVCEARDSLLNDKTFFKGQIKDDYGFSKLQFTFKKYNTSDTIKKNFEIPLQKGVSTQEFYYSFNLQALQLALGDKIEYYFEVWDNDAIHKPKSTKSQIFEIYLPTEKELQNQIDKNIDNIENVSNLSISDIKKTQKEISDLMQKLLDKKELSWQDKKEFEALAEKQKQLRKNIAQMQEQIHQNNLLQEQYREQNEAILEKQKELEHLYDELMNNDMKELMKELEKLLNNIDKSNIQETLEKIKLKNEDVEKQLDQNIELMKRLEAEKLVENAIKKTEELAEKQRKLAEETSKSSKKDTEKLRLQQEQLNMEFQDLKNSLDKAQEKFNQLEDSPTLKRNKNIENQINKNQNEATQNLNKGKNKNASQNQNDAADNLEKMSDQLESSLSDMEQEDLAEDVETVRQLLKNLLTLSFNQENLIYSVNSTLIQDTKYQDIIKQQNQIKANFSTIEDSLRTMAKRQIKVASIISKELATINQNLSTSMRDLLRLNQAYYKQNKNKTASTSMQYTVTSLNNLALVLAESLDKMQSQMRQNQQKKSGNCKKSGSCSNPQNGSSGKKTSPKTMKQLQDALNKQIESLRKQIKNNSQKTNNNSRNSEFSEQFARLAAQQEQIRRMMQKYAEELKQQSSGNLGKDLNEILKQMEQTETELVNKTITQQTIIRQQQILTRMLEYEKAQMQKEKEEHRTSTESKDIFQISQPDLEKYKQLKNKNIEIIKTPPPSFSDYYKQKVNEYFFEK